MSDFSLPLGGGRRLSRARLIALQTAVGCLVAGVAFSKTADAGSTAVVSGYVLAGAGVLLIALSLLRRRGQWADVALLRRIRRDALRTAPVVRTGSRPQLGLVHRLLPALDVGEAPDRNSPTPLGVISDGRGTAAVIELPGGALPALPVPLLADWLANDPARPAAVQLVVEQFGMPPWDLLYRYQPTIAYRQLPVQGIPVAVRSWLVVRHEPLDAPETVERRGGGPTGAGAALAAATARLRARLAEHDATTRTLDADEVSALLRQTGDASAGGRELLGCWAGDAATHCTVTAQVSSQSDWARLLNGLAQANAQRVVTAATVALDGDQARVRTAVRLVSTIAENSSAERDRLIQAKIVGPPAPDQLAGILATLPVAYPAHSLAEATGSALMGQHS